MSERGTPMRGRKEICDQRRIGCFTVSGRSQTMTAAASASETSAMKGKTSGSAEYSASRPEISAPRPSPERIAPALKLAAVQRSSQSSTIQAVPAPEASGRASPLNSLPMNSMLRASAKMKTSDATMLMVTAARIATRLPISSEIRPRKKAVAIAPAK